MADEIYPTVVCHECGQTDTARYADPTKRIMVQRRLCFLCVFWTEKVEMAVGPEADRIVRIAGTHYLIGEPLPPELPAHCAGFGGQAFTIRFFDGRVVETRNLWCQSKIPLHFRDRLPDNAEFVRDGYPTFQARYGRQV